MQKKYQWTKASVATATTAVSTIDPAVKIPTLAITTIAVITAHKGHKEIPATKPQVPVPNTSTGVTG